MRRLLLSLVLLTSLPLLAGAQQPDSLWIGGTVVDTTGRSVADAVVLVQPDGLNTRTDAQGFFALRVAAGPAILVVRRIGFGALQTELALEAGVDRRFRIELSPIPQLLDAVVTEARKPYMPPDAPASMDDFYRRRAEAKGRTFTREELERSGSLRAALATVPGIRVDSDAFGNVVGIRVPRCLGAGTTASTGTGADGLPTTSVSSVAWFLDGNRTATAPDLRDQDIEAVEVYRGSSALPAEAIGNACAAVFVWTRRAP